MTEENVPNTCAPPHFYRILRLWTDLSLTLRLVNSLSPALARHRVPVDPLNGRHHGHAGQSDRSASQSELGLQSGVTLSTRVARRRT